MKIIRIAEHPATVPGAGRLGRHVRHDPRSLRYLAPAGDIAGLASVRHTRHIDVLNQGQVGACTGFAAEYCVATGALYDAIPAGLLARPTPSVTIDEGQARMLYSAATDLDGIDGTYPPDDTGSDGLSVAKACKSVGLISGYTHATSLAAVLTALARQPVIAGINWYDSFDTPDADGWIGIATGAQIRGGHEICLDELDVENRRIGFVNSWGQWGEDGRAYIGWDDFARLLSENGDVTVFTPLTSPSPVPTPPAPPAPDDSTAELTAMVRRWFAEGVELLKKLGL